MLQEDKQLFQLYNDLVVSGVISAEEFWANRMQVILSVEHQQLFLMKLSIFWTINHERSIMQGLTMI